MYLNLLENFSYRLVQSEGEFDTFEVLSEPQKGSIVVPEQELFVGDSILVKSENYDVKEFDVEVDKIELNVEADAENIDRNGGNIDLEVLEGVVEISFIKGRVTQVEKVENGVKYYFDVEEGEYSSWEYEDFLL